MLPVHWLSVAVLGILPWPLVNLVSIPQFRREYRCLALRGVVLLAVYYLLVVVLLAVAAWLLVPLAAVAAVVLFAERFRARRNFGRRRRLPPGTLSLVPRRPWIDERYYTAQAARHGTVFKMSQYLRPMVCLIGPREGVRFFKDHAAALASPPVRFSGLIPRGYIRFMKAGDHARYRPLLRAVLGQPVVRDCMPDCASILRQRLAQMAAEPAGGAAPGIHPLTPVHAMVFDCMLRLFLGITDEHAESAELHRLLPKLQIGKAVCQSGANQRELAGRIAAIVARHGASHGAGLPASALRELLRREPGAPRDATMLLNLVYMIRIASEDLSGFLVWAIKLLIDNPAWAERLALAACDPREDADALVALTIREVLRLERSEFIFRKAISDIDYQGFRIPAGWIVRICIRDGHRDPGAFPDPATFDPQRFAGRTLSNEVYSPLGIGAHACIGGRVIDGVAGAFLKIWTGSYRVTVHRDGPREYGRSHWQPSAKLRVSLRER